MSNLQFRLGRTEEFPALKEMIIDSFEPITWFKKLDAEFGPLNGRDWRDRWNLRLNKVFASQIILVGQAGDAVVAVATGTADPDTRTGFIDLLGVDIAQQGKGYGRQMLQGMLDHFRQQGMEHARLECLTDNEKGNALYRSAGWSLVSSSNMWFLKL